MKVVIQRVKEAKVEVNNKIVGQIKQGLLIFLAIHTDDSEETITKMAEKVLNLRIFTDDADKMNLSVKDIAGEILVVSQFTLYGNCKKGNRPSFVESARPEKALPFYNKFVLYLRDKNMKVETGEFGAKMSVELLNDGPVTLIFEL